MIDKREEFVRHAPPGAIVEAGCWKGGLGAYMALSGRDTYLFDSFDGLPETSEKDSDMRRTLPLKQKTNYLKVSEESVYEISRKLKVDPYVIKGWFNETLPQWKEKIGKIAVLHVDGDIYSSTKEVLSCLYDNVVKGGVIVMDDYYTYGGSRRALYEFFQENSIIPALRSYPFGKVYFIK